MPIDTFPGLKYHQKYSCSQESAPDPAGGGFHALLQILCPDFWSCFKVEWRGTEEETREGKDRRGRMDRK